MVWYLLLPPPKNAITALSLNNPAKWNAINHLDEFTQNSVKLNVNRCVIFISILH